MTRLSPEASAYMAEMKAKWPGPLSVPPEAGPQAQDAASRGRKALTRLNPRMFALTYLSHHLSGDETDGVISFSEAHLDWYDQMRGWVKPIREPKVWRRAYVAPRNSAKSTVWFLVAALWAAAHGHSKFIAAFADSASQAEGHLQTFKHELDTNVLLQRDFPKLCRAAYRLRGVVVGDNKGMIYQRSGFVFVARGIDSSVLGMKVEHRRPDLILLDDVEPNESNYSAHQVEKRLSTVQNAILPLNDWARVVMVGTVVMPGSLIHQLVQTQTTDLPPADWIRDELFRCCYYPALIQNDDGTERSLWPEKWSLEYLTGMRHHRAFALNYQNRPLAVDGTYWSVEDIRVEPLPVDAATRTILSVDPAVTSREKSDYTGLAVLSHDRRPTLSLPAGKVYVRHARKVKLDPRRLRVVVSQILERFPEIRVIFCEVNQGGDLWREVFDNLPVKYVTVHQSVRKEVRAGWLLNGYQKGEVVHAEELPELDEELLAFPGGMNDDQVDAVGSGYAWLTGAGQPKQPSFAGRTV